MLLLKLETSKITIFHFCARRHLRLRLRPDFQKDLSRAPTSHLEVQLSLEPCRWVLD
jgi:hypothetical protein